MALDKEYFDGIEIAVVKKKYYNANKVNALLADIRGQALALTEENAGLKAQLEELNRHRAQIGDTLLTAQAAAREILEKAKAQAKEIVADSRQQQSQLRRGAVEQQEYAARSVEKCMNRLKRQQLENVEMLNHAWQDFLCGLDLEQNREPEEAAAPAEKAERPRRDELEAMVNAIARELMEIMGEGE